MSPAPASDGPLIAAQLVNCLGLGGTERQLVELLRRLEPQAVAARLACLQKKGEFLESVLALGLDPPEFGLRGSLLRPNTLLQALRLAAWLRRSGASLLHCHDFYSNLLGSLAARIAGVPWIVSRRDLGVWTGPAHARLLAMVTRRAPFVLCNSDAVRDLVVHREGADPARVRVIPNGIDLERFDREAAASPRPPVEGLRPEAPVVALVANMKHGVKGHGDFLLAAASVARALPAARFLLVGDGGLRPELERRARELGLGSAAIFTGRRTDVPSLLSRCTAAVSSSRSEGLSNAIMEAMAASLPVVATAVGGNVELVRDGRTGFLVRPGDASQLAARLVDVLRDPGLAARLGHAGRRRVEDEYSARRLGERLQMLYAEIAGRRVQVRRAA